MMTRPGPKVDAAWRIAWNRLWPVSPVATRASASRSNSALAAVVLPRSAPSAISVERHRRQRRDRQARKHQARRRLSRRVGERQMACAADHDRHDFRVGLAGDLGDRPVEPEAFGARFDLVGEIDGEPAVAFELAHQPARHENVLGVEDDGARKAAERLQPCGICRIVVEDVQRVLGQQRQHHRRIDLRLVGDHVDDRRIGLRSDADAAIVDLPGELEGRVEQPLPVGDSQAIRLDPGDRRIGSDKASDYGSGQDHAAPPVVTMRIVTSACGEG